MPNVETVERQTIDPAVRSLARIKRLTDVTYGLSFLLILLQIDRPDPAVLLSSESINRYLNDQLPSLGIYLTTFVLVGFYWQSHLFMASRFVRSDATHRWLQLGGLMGVALLPFVNDLLELMPLQSSIQVAYSLVLVQIGFFDLLTLVHGWRRPELLAEPLQVQHRWHLLFELALEPGVCLLSVGVSLFLSPAWWEWTFLMLLPGYGLLWWMDQKALKTPRIEDQSESISPK